MTLNEAYIDLLKFPHVAKSYREICKAYLQVGMAKEAEAFKAILTKRYALSTSPNEEQRNDSSTNN